MAKQSHSPAGTDAWSQLKTGWKQARKFLAEDTVLSWIANLLIAFVIIKFIVYPGLGLLLGTSLPVVAVVSSSMDHSAINAEICGQQVIDSYSGSLDQFWDVCGGWYEQKGITKEQFQAFSFKNGFKKGDIMVLVGTKRSNLKLGDILVFQTSQSYPIIHRIINLSDQSDGSGLYQTKGDHNSAQIQQYVLFDEFGKASACQSNGLAAPCFVGSPVTMNTPGAVRVIDESHITKEQVIGKAVIKIPWFGWIKIWFTDIVQWLAGLFASH